MDSKSILSLLKNHANPKNAAGMVRFGINPKNTLGISIPFLRSLAKKIGKDHKLAAQLWKTRIHEARLLAGFIDDYKQVTVKQMDSWARDFDSWDIPACRQAGATRCAPIFLTKLPGPTRKRGSGLKAVRNSCAGRAS